jgi:hypothetical protein
MMKAREPIDRASFGPDALKAIGQAFDEPWASLAGNHGDDQVEAARLRLADALLSIANDDSRNVETIKKWLSTGCALHRIGGAKLASELATLAPQPRSQFGKHVLDEVSRGSSQFDSLSEKAGPG